LPQRDTRESQAQREAVAALVKSRDPDRYWSTLFAPPDTRESLLALYAFHSELAHIPLLISEPMVGQIRLQWWRDAIDLAAPGVRTGNPIADALAAAMATHDLPKERLLAMVDARQPEIDRAAPADIGAIRAGLQKTTGTVFELAAGILGATGGSIAGIAMQAGVAEGLTRLLLALPRQAAQRSLLIPPSYFESRGVDIAAIHRGQTSPALQAALADLRGAASKALGAAKFGLQRSTDAPLAAFLPLAAIEPYLSAMAETKANPLHAIPRVNPLRRFWRVWRAARRGRL
jgi:phytoene synthase